MGILGKIGGAVSATTAAIQAHHQKVQAKKAANKQAKQQQAQPQQTQPSGSGGSNFGPKILVQLNQHKSKLIWVILILAAIFAGLVAWLGWAPVKSFLWKYVFKILVGIVGLVVLGIAFKNDDDKLTKRMVLIPYIIWLFLDINNFLGGPYQGFKFELSILAQTNWPAVLTSSLVSAALFYKMFDEFFNRDLMFVFSMIGLIAINYSAAKLLPQLNDTLPSWLIPVLFVLLAAIIILAYFKFRNSYTFNPDSIGYTIMVFVFSFYWINWSWTANFKAVIHVVWILVFCLGYLSFIPDAKKGQLYLFTSLFLIADFFFYQFEIAPGLKFPLIVIISSFIGYRFTKSIFALTNMWMILMLVWALWFTPVAVAQGVTLEEKTPEGPTGIVPTIKTWLSAFERKISGTVGERIDIATGGYSGLVEQNQYESLGVYFADPRAGEPKFYPGQPVTVWATIRSKTYQDPVIIENFKCEAKKNNAITKTAEVVSPDRPLPVFKLEENDVRCTFKNGLDTGSNEVTLSAKYNFATNAYIKSYFINRETYREMIRENLDPLAEFGITDKEPKTVFTNGPVGISMNVGPLIYVTEGSDRATSPTLNVVIHNRQNTEDKDKRIISQWEGRVNEINEVIILTPPYVTIDARLDCQTDNPDSSCPCNRPVAPYEVGDCRNSCTEIQRKCNEACKDPRGNEDAGCKRECEKSFNGCNEDCDSLFRVSPGEGPEKEIYNGYSLRVYGGGFVKDEYKDIEGEKYATFFCTLIPDYRVLDSKQLATRYFRVRARYDYTLENTLSIPIDQIPAISRNDVTDLISKFSQEYSSPPSVVIDPNLIRAIIYREAKGGVHCCQQSGRNHWRECEPSFDTTCGADRILTSYDDSSIGIMQINVRDSPFDRWKTDASKNSDGTPLCGNNIDGTPKTVYDQDCNIEIGIKLFRQKYDADKGGREYRCRDANGKVIFRETYTEWDAAIRGYHGWGCSSANCDEKCLDELRRYVSIIKDIKQKIDNGAINLLVQASGQLQEAPRTDPLESPLNPIAQDTQNADKSVTISWEASPTPGVQYRIYRFRVDKTQITQIGAPIIIPAGQLSYTDTQGIMDGQTYKYTISALRGREQSEAVPTDEITPVADAPAPSGTP